MSDHVPKLIVFGAGGHTLYLGRGHTCSGYERPETLCVPYHWWSHPAGVMSTHLDVVGSEGCPVLDIRAAVAEKAGFRMVVSGPMVDVSLAAGEVDRCPEPSPIMAGALSGSSNAFGGLLALQGAARATRPGAPGPLDSVSIGHYVRLWRECGARVGMVRGGGIVFDDAPEWGEAPKLFPVFDLPAPIAPAPDGENAASL